MNNKQRDKILNDIVDDYNNLVKTKEKNELLENDYIVFKKAINNYRILKYKNKYAIYADESKLKDLCESYGIEINKFNLFKFGIMTSKSLFLIFTLIYILYISCFIHLYSIDYISLYHLILYMFSAAFIPIIVDYVHYLIYARKS